MAAACYWWITRPSAIANRFVLAIENRDYDAADVVCTKPNRPFVQTLIDGSSDKADHVEAKILHRNWRDIWQGRQRIELQIVRRSTSGKEIVESLVLTASPSGVIRSVDPFSVNIR